MSTHSSAFRQLEAFITERMRMSHIYQPLMIKVLIESGGWASTRNIASAFLAHDESQVEYYEEIAKRMPGKVLTTHGIVERERNGYRLLPDVRELSKAEQAEISRLCDQALGGYLARRVDRLFNHRRTALGEVSGTDRYEILRRAGFRCELCGISADERALEIDHIIPRRHGGGDERPNLQALCYKCNANKGDRDDTDFRAVRAEMNKREAGCVFCDVAPDRIVAQNELAIAISDRFPVTPLHTLVVSRRHAATFFDLFEPERRAMNLLLDELRNGIKAKDQSVEGFNIGFNCGESAGQTVLHCHAHLIPRRRGDVENPRGGIRGVIPGKASY